MQKRHGYNIVKFGKCVSFFQVKFSLLEPSLLLISDSVIFNVALSTGWNYGWLSNVQLHQSASCMLVFVGMYSFLCIVTLRSFDHLHVRKFDGSLHAYFKVYMTPIFFLAY